MTVKPGAAGAVAAILVGYGLGAAIALLVTKQSGKEGTVCT
jgi:hypothetical protein